MCELSYMIIFESEDGCSNWNSKAHKTAKLRTVKFCFLIYPHNSFRVPCGISVQWFSPGRSPSYPILKKSLKLLLQTLRVVESYPFTKFDKIPLINFADFSSL